MKKIMFNDKYGLTQAVLDGRKTMTRRVVNQKGIDDFCVDDTTRYFVAHNYAAYQVGEVVAVAQSYKTLNERGYVAPEWCEHTCESSAGYENKMFVRAELMPHYIRITDIKVERLQDISDVDCWKEGIYERAALHSLHVNGYAYTFDNWSYRGIVKGSDTPKGAFATLIDKVSGKGTWDSNPWVFAYTFELVD